MSQSDCIDQLTRVSRRISRGLYDGNMPVGEAATQLNDLVLCALKTAILHRSARNFKRCDGRPLDMQWLQLEGDHIGAVTGMIRYLAARLADESMTRGEAATRMEEIGTIFANESVAWVRQYVTPMPVAA